ncbi:MAG: hypothetical protein QXV60_02685 [Nitrososphaerota archaeon]
MCNLPSDIDTMIKKCSGDVGPGEPLFKYWEQVDCLSLYSYAINVSNGKLSYNPTCHSDIQEQVNNLFITYLQEYQITDNITSPKFNPFQFKLLDLCLDPRLPGVCTKFLENYCANFNREQVTASPILTNFCGCYVQPDPNYLHYTLGTTGCQIGVGCTGCTGANCVPQPACDPLCNRALTSKRFYQPNGNLITCSENVCVIDDVIVNVQNSQVPGGINFNSICTGCNKQGCLCIISGVDISTTMSNIGVGVNFNQFCGSNSVCLVKDSKGDVISHSTCKDFNPNSVILPKLNELPNLGIVILIIIVLLIVLLLVIKSNWNP